MKISHDLKKKNYWKLASVCETYEDKINFYDLYIPGCIRIRFKPRQGNCQAMSSFHQEWNIDPCEYQAKPCDFPPNSKYMFLKTNTQRYCLWTNQQPIRLDATRSWKPNAIYSVKRCSFRQNLLYIEKPVKRSSSNLANQPPSFRKLSSNSIFLKEDNWAIDSLNLND